MAEYGEWSRKGATLSDKTARKEYKIEQEMIIKGIESGKLEYCYSAVFGKGSEYLIKATGKIELKKIKKEISELEGRLNHLQSRKAELERV